ncbi:MAG: hypothetical protein ACE5PV_18205 [Candidatus Poribacteria bacterium]
MAKKLWYHYINDATKFLRRGNADELINKISRLPNTQVIRNARNKNRVLFLDGDVDDVRLRSNIISASRPKDEAQTEFMHSRHFTLNVS